jgi:hypothetical protein
MGAVSFGVPMPLANQLCDSLCLGAAVETGTFYGESARALGEIVPTVWSIERSPELHAAAKARFIDRPDLNFAQGYSAEVLPGILESVTTPGLFWLAGQWSGGETAGVGKECPVLDETHDPRQWPAFIDVLDGLRSSYLRFVTVLDDVIIAGPLRCRETVEAHWLDELAMRSDDASAGTRWPEPIRSLVSRARAWL